MSRMIMHFDVLTYVYKYYIYNLLTKRENYLLKLIYFNE